MRVVGGLCETAFSRSVEWWKGLEKLNRTSAIAVKPRMRWRWYTVLMWDCFEGSVKVHINEVTYNTIARYELGYN